MSSAISSDISLNVPSSATRALLERQQQQQQWQATPIRKRLAVLKRARHCMAVAPERFAEAISPVLARTTADTLASELLPLLDACRFLEREAATILASRSLGSANRPAWLHGVEAEIQRDPFGHILVIGPSNFPLFLPGVQVLQALAAGNSVTWKPGAGGAPVAQLVADALVISGLPPSLLTIADDTVYASQLALSGAYNKVIFTGSGDAGRDVLRRLSDTATPAVMELSGADAVIVLPSANLARVAKAIAFGLRLNGAAVCMSPRRLLALGDTMSALLPMLERELASVPPISLPSASADKVRALLDLAVSMGATIRGEWNPSQQRPLLIASALPTMHITCTDIAAPILSLITVSTTPKFPDVYAECVFALTVAVFGAEAEALTLGQNLQAGTLLVNDIIVPTADPRVPFTGRGGSGFGATRGAEGLLEMTAPKTVLVRRGKSIRHWQPTSAQHVPLFEGAIRAAHGGSWLERAKGLRQTISASRNIAKQGQ